MGRYDRDWGRDYGRDFGYRSGYRAPWGGDRWGGASGWRGEDPFPGRGLPGRPWWEPSGMPRGYDAGTFGGGYGGGYGYASPTYGGYPGSRDRGLYYGGRGYGLDHDRSRGYAGRGYGGEFARRPFIPERAYREHPELNRPPREMGGQWPDRWPDDTDEELDDGEIRQRVEQNLHQDDWVDAGRIQVEVHESVVTLRGEVDDYLEARYAWDDAWETEGVRGVLNQLTVQTTGTVGSHGDPFPQNEATPSGVAGKGTSGGKK